MKEKKHFKVSSLVLCVLVTLMAVVSGCSINHNYKWKEYEIDQERISAPNRLNAKAAVSIINAQPNDAKRILGSITVHRYHGSLQQLTDGIVTQFAQQLERRGVKIGKQAAKKIEIKVVDANLVRGAWRIRADMNVSVKTADGYSRIIKIENGTPATVDRAYNGALALAVIEILNDSKIIEYLNK